MTTQLIGDQFQLTKLAIAIFEIKMCQQIISKWSQHQQAAFPGLSAQSILFPSSTKPSQSLAIWLQIVLFEHHEDTRSNSRSGKTMAQN